MRTNFIKFFVAFVALLGFYACGDKDVPTAAPTIEIKESGKTSTSITFSVNVKGATECAYYLYDGDVITVDAVFANGVAIKANTKSVEVKNLESDTKYYIIAAAKNSVGATLSDPLIVTTDADDNGGNNGNGGNDDPFVLPEIDGVENIVITKTTGGCWYSEYNYYVYFVLENGDRIQLDFYTLNDTMSLYFPYGAYTLADNYYPYTIHPDGSCYLPNGWEGYGYAFTDAYVTVDVVNGYYAIYMMLTYEVDGVSKSIQGYYNGIMSNASVPGGDDNGSKELITVHEVGSSSFSFSINAEPDQYWRCSIVDKRVYDQYQSNPGAWVVNYGFMLQGPLTFNWENGKVCEYVPGYTMQVSPSTDYLILAALMDYSEGQENVLLSGVEIKQIRTTAEAAGNATVDVTMKEINVNDVVFDCVFGDDVWCCYVAMMKTADLQEIKDGKYAMAGYSSFEECMLSLIQTLAHSSMRQFLEPQYDYKWDYLNYDTSYTMCIKVVDQNNAASYVEYGPFTTKK